MGTMVPDQCCEKIDCIYSYMGLNHGTHLRGSLNIGKLTHTGGPGSNPGQAKL